MGVQNKGSSSGARAAKLPQVDLNDPNVRLVMDAVSQKLADVPVSKAQKEPGLSLKAQAALRILSVLLC